MRSFLLVPLLSIACGAPDVPEPEVPRAFPLPRRNRGGDVVASASLSVRRGALLPPERAEGLTAEFLDDVYVRVRLRPPVPTPYTVAATSVTDALIHVVQDKRPGGFVVAAVWAGSGATVRWPQIALHDFDLVVVK